jgi:hypothetical protein
MFVGLKFALIACAAITIGAVQTAATLAQRAVAIKTL